MATTLARVLIVDDFEPFRRLLRLVLEGSAEIFEVSDGLASVEQSALLQPDLILLDIGLPGLDGIEAARRIRAVAPNSKILFISQESSTDIVRAALATGAMGYVVKADIADELVVAVRALLQGGKYVGGRFAGALITGEMNGEL